MPGLLALMEAVRAKESSNDYQNNNNPLFKGAYQFGTAAFVTTGYKNQDGSWTGKNGINSIDDWLAETPENPDIERIQDSAFLEWIMYHWSKIRGEDAEPLAGQILNGEQLTISGIIMGAHLVGETDFRDEYILSGGTNIPRDGNGVPVTDYIQRFGGYDLSDLTGVDPDIIPAGFSAYFVTNHELDNVFNRHSDDNIDLIGNANTNDYPMHLGTGNDKINGFAGNDTVFGASGGNDTMDGGTHAEGVGDTMSYDEQAVGWVKPTTHCIQF